MSSADHPRDPKTKRFVKKPRLPDAKPFVFGGFGEEDRKFLREQVSVITHIAARIETDHRLHLGELRTWRKRRTRDERLVDFAAGALVVATVVFLFRVFSLTV